jgi:hypothetical protein
VDSDKPVVHACDPRREVRTFREAIQTGLRCSRWKGGAGTTDIRLKARQFKEIQYDDCRVHCGQTQRG